MLPLKGSKHFFNCMKEGKIRLWSNSLSPIPFSSHHNAFCNQNIENKNIDFIPVTAGAKGELLNPNGTPVEYPLKVVLFLSLLLNQLYQ